jgi:hypothetical protein
VTILRWSHAKRYAHYSCGHSSFFRYARTCVRCAKTYVRSCDLRRRGVSASCRRSCGPMMRSAFCHLRMRSASCHPMMPSAFYRLLTDWTFWLQPLQSSIVREFAYQA